MSNNWEILGIESSASLRFGAANLFFQEKLQPDYLQLVRKSSKLTIDLEDFTRNVAEGHIRVLDKPVSVPPNIEIDDLFTLYVHQSFIDNYKVKIKSDFPVPHNTIFSTLKKREWDNEEIISVYINSSTNISNIRHKVAQKYYEFTHGMAKSYFENREPSILKEIEISAGFGISAVNKKSSLLLELYKLVGLSLFLRADSQNLLSLFRHEVQEIPNLNNMNFEEFIQSIDDLKKDIAIDEIPSPAKPPFLSDEKFKKLVLDNLEELKKQNLALKKQDSRRWRSLQKQIDTLGIRLARGSGVPQTFGTKKPSDSWSDNAEPVTQTYLELKKQDSRRRSSQEKIDTLGIWLVRGSGVPRTFDTKKPSDSWSDNAERVTQTYEEEKQDLGVLSKKTNPEEQASHLIESDPL